MAAAWARHAMCELDFRCLVLVHMYGNNPRKLFLKIVRNSEVRISEFPLFSFPLLRILFISWCPLFISRLTIVLFRDGNQFIVGINSNPTAVPVQFKVGT